MAENAQRPAKQHDVLIPWTDAVRQIAKEAARAVIESHLQTCIVHELRERITVAEARLHKLEISWAKLMGICAGFGGLSGGLGSAIVVWLT
jgi:hypothetical protein